MENTVKVNIPKSYTQEERNTFLGIINVYNNAELDWYGTVHELLKFEDTVWLREVTEFVDNVYNTEYLDELERTNLITTMYNAGRPQKEE